MMPFTMFMVNICGWNCKSPSMSHNAPSMRWSAFRESNMKMSQSFNSIEETDACEEIVRIASSSKSSGSFLNLKQVRLSVNHPHLRIRRITPVVYWEGSLFFSLGYTADECSSTAM